VVCAVIMFLQARTRFGVIEESDTTERSSDIASSSVGAPGSVREYYEKKAAIFEKEATPVEDKPAIAAMPPISASAPLPSLPAIIDDAAAQECFVRAGEFEAAGERDKAIEQYTKAIRLNAKHTMAYFRRGMLLMEMGFKPAAVADFRRVIEIADNPELADIAKTNIAKLG
jgi:tetratricopeptide (TPR) repeat protein